MIFHLNKTFWFEGVKIKSDMGNGSEKMILSIFQYLDFLRKKNSLNLLVNESSMYSL